jgi:hypothetical protein
MPISKEIVENNEQGIAENNEQEIVEIIEDQIVAPVEEQIVEDIEEEVVEEREQLFEKANLFSRGFEREKQGPSATTSRSVPENRFRQG